MTCLRSESQHELELGLKLLSVGLTEPPNPNLAALPGTCPFRPSGLLSQELTVLTSTVGSPVAGTVPPSPPPPPLTPDQPLGAAEASEQRRRSQAVSVLSPGLGKGQTGPSAHITCLPCARRHSLHTYCVLVLVETKGCHLLEEWTSPLSAVTPRASPPQEQQVRHIRPIYRTGK